MTHTIEMCSDALICIPNFINIGSVILKLIMGIHLHRQTGMQTYKHTYRQHRDLISLFLFLQNYAETI